jgi:DNA-binding transcriptional MerR regulator
MAEVHPSVTFTDGKDQDALRTIGEVSAALGIRQHVLRYWEDQFPMLRPMKRSGGRRYYRPEDVSLVAVIDRLVHREGYTLRGARQAIEGGEANAPIPKVSPNPSSPSPSKRSDISLELRAIRDDLAAALRAS